MSFWLPANTVTSLQSPIDLNTATTTKHWSQNSNNKHWSQYNHKLTLISIQQQQTLISIQQQPALISIQQQQTLISMQQQQTLITLQQQHWSQYKTMISLQQQHWSQYSNNTDPNTKHWSYYSSNKHWSQYSNNDHWSHYSNIKLTLISIQQHQAHSNTTICYYHYITIDQSFYFYSFTFFFRQSLHLVILTYRKMMCLHTAVRWKGANAKTDLWRTSWNTRKHARRSVWVT